MSAMANRLTGALCVTPVLDSGNVGSGSAKVTATCVCLFSFILRCGAGCCEAQRLSLALGVLEELWPLVVHQGHGFGKRRKDDRFAC